MADFTIKQNDTSPAIEVILQDNDGNAVDITGNLGVDFHMIDKAGTTKINSAATVVDAATGQVKYQWVIGDTDTLGVFRAEWEVTYSDSNIETFPNNTNLNILVFDDLI